MNCTMEATSGTMTTSEHEHQRVNSIGDDFAVLGDAEDNNVLEEGDGINPAWSCGSLIRKLGLEKAKGVATSAETPKRGLKIGNRKSESLNEN